MITDIDGCSGRGVSVDMTNCPDVAQVRNIKPERPPTERRHHQVVYHKGDSIRTAVTPSPSTKSKLELNAGFLKFLPYKLVCKKLLVRTQPPIKVIIS